MAPENLIGWLAASLLLSLRISPVFAFAPPFTLVRVPPLVRVIIALGLSTALVSATPALVVLPNLTLASILPVALAELLLGASFVLIFQIAHAAIQVAGRTVDIQAGFGLAAVLDPTTRAQMPLVGSLYAFTAGAVFFGLDGHLQFVRIIAASIEAVPLGQAVAPQSLEPLTRFLAVAFLTGFGVAGGAILALFLTDLGIAFLSRTAPQMNALVLGFQAKTLLLLVVLPMTFGVSAALLARLVSITLEALPTMLA